MNRKHIDSNKGFMDDNYESFSKILKDTKYESKSSLLTSNDNNLKHNKSYYNDNTPVNEIFDYNILLETNLASDSQKEKKNVQKNYNQNRKAHFKQNSQKKIPDEEISSNIVNQTENRKKNKFKRGHKNHDKSNGNILKNKPCSFDMLEEPTLLENFLYNLQNSEEYRETDEYISDITALSEFPYTGNIARNSLKHSLFSAKIPYWLLDDFIVLNSFDNMHESYTKWPRKNGPIYTVLDMSLEDPALSSCHGIAPITLTTLSTSQYTSYIKRLKGLANSFLRYSVNVHRAIIQIVQLFKQNNLGLFISLTSSHLYDVVRQASPVELVLIGSKIDLAEIKNILMEAKSEFMVYSIWTSANLPYIGFTLFDVDILIRVINMSVSLDENTDDIYKLITVLKESVICNPIYSKDTGAINAPIKILTKTEFWDNLLKEEIYSGLMNFPSIFPNVWSRNLLRFSHQWGYCRGLCSGLLDLISNSTILRISLFFISLVENKQANLNSDMISTVENDKLESILLKQKHIEHLDYTKTILQDTFKAEDFSEDDWQDSYKNNPQQRMPIKISQIPQIASYLKSFPTDILTRLFGIDMTKSISTLKETQENSSRSINNILLFLLWISKLPLQNQFITNVYSLYNLRECAKTSIRSIESAFDIGAAVARECIPPLPSILYQVHTASNRHHGSTKSKQNKDIKTEEQKDLVTNSSLFQSVNGIKNNISCPVQIFGLPPLLSVKNLICFRFLSKSRNQLVASMHEASSLFTILRRAFLQSNTFIRVGELNTVHSEKFCYEIFFTNNFQLTKTDNILLKIESIIRKICAIELEIFPIEVENLFQHFSLSLSWELGLKKRIPYEPTTRSELIDDPCCSHLFLPKPIHIVQIAEAIGRSQFQSY